MIGGVFGRSAGRVFLLACGVVGALFASGAAMAGQPARQQPKRPLAIYQMNVKNDRINVLVTLHKSENVKVDYPFSEALVGDPSIADVMPLTNQSIYILGKKVGVTRISLLDPKKQILGVVDIEVSYDLEALRHHLRSHPALRQVKVSSINGKVLLTGTVPDAPAAQKAMLLADQVAPGEATNALSVAAPQQVSLEVRFIEAARSVGRGVGVNYGIKSNEVSAITGVEAQGGLYSTAGATGSDVSINSLLGLASGLSSNAVPFGTGIGHVLAGSVRADIVIRALEQRGLARRLAEPNLVAQSGGTASFLAGGEFPFPVVGLNNQLSVDFKKFGVGLTFTPTVLANGQINLKIDPEVSDLDTTRAVEIGNYKIPSIVVRRASTTIELRDGQSFAMAGLLQGSHTADERQLPWIGQVPVLGALFRSSSFQKNETDLVIIVTPRLVRPSVPGEKLKTPLDGSVPASDAELFLEGQQEVSTRAPVALAGHILDYSAGETQAQPSFFGLK